MDNAPPPAAPARLKSLDVLRGLCAAIVFFSHWHLWSGFAPRDALEKAVHASGEFFHDGFALFTWPTGGHHPAVIGFFVLSGFCIHYPFERRARAGGATPDWRDYFRRRFWRIMPVYWAACALGLAFVFVETRHPSGSPLLQLHAQSSVEDILVRLAGIAGLYPREIFSGNYILTTVTVEMVMYAAYPLFYRYAGRGHWRALGAAFVAMHVFAIALLPYVTPFWVFNSVFMLGIFWFAGAWAAHLYLVHRPRVRGIWLLLAWAVFLALKATPHFYGLNLFKQAAWGLVCMLGILWVLRWEPALAAVRWRRGIAALRWSGEISYSLYAIHTPAIMLATWLLLRLGQDNYLLQLAATMTASIAATLALHHGVENVFYRPRPETPASDAAANRTASPPPRS